MRIKRGKIRRIYAPIWPLGVELVKMSLITSLVSAIIGLTMAVQLTNNIMKKQCQGVPVRFHEHPRPPFQVSQTPTNTYDNLFEYGTKATGIMGKSNTIYGFITTLFFSSLYYNRYIEIINDTNDFTETLVQEIIESSFVILLAQES